MGRSGYTDASQFIKANPKLPIIIFGPGNGETAHQTDEYTEISSFNNGLIALEKLILSYLK